MRCSTHGVSSGHALGLVHAWQYLIPDPDVYFETGNLRICGGSQYNDMHYLHLLALILAKTLDNKSSQKDMKTPLISPYRFPCRNAFNKESNPLMRGCLKAFLSDLNLET